MITMMGKRRSGLTIKQVKAGETNATPFPAVLGPINFRERILLTLLAAGAILETGLAEASRPPSISYALSSFEAQDFFRKKRRTSTATLSYLLAEKFIAARGINQRKMYGLTEEGVNFLFARFPALKYANRKWDGYWRVVIYDIPEKDYLLRDRLRQELKKLGFKFVQRSVWITPQPVEEDLKTFLLKERLWGKIIILKSIMPPEEDQRFAAAYGYAHAKNPPLKRGDAWPS